MLAHLVNGKCKHNTNKSLSFMLDRTYPKDKLQTCNRDLSCTFMNSLCDHINLK